MAHSSSNGETTSSLQKVCFGQTEASSFNGVEMIQFTVHLKDAVIMQVSFNKDHLSIGRSDSNDVVLNNAHISRQAAVIEWEGTRYQIFNKNKNGIFLDNQPLKGPTPLPSRCRLTIYPFEIACAQVDEDETRPLPSVTHSAPKEDALAESSIIRSCPASTVHFGGLIGESPAMKELYKLILDVGDSPATVLIRGEHGTGKELVARALHHSSSRNGSVFLPVNCAALPLDLMESELFGYEKGAFTGASNMKIGKIEQAKNGTIFLDEIGELSLPAQAKLLRVLQQHAIMRVGGSQEILTDVRFITATNRNLEQDIKNGSFREDLYYRLRVVQIVVPPLRERTEDLPALIDHFLRKLGQELRLDTVPIVTDKGMKLLLSAHWPGNVRQLENILYSVILRSRPTYTIDDEIIYQELPPDFSYEDKPESDSEDKPSLLEDVNREALIKVLTEQKWDTQRAAKALNVSRGTVYYKIKKYGIHLPR